MKKKQAVLNKGNAGVFPKFFHVQHYRYSIGIIDKIYQKITAAKQHCTYTLVYI